MHTSQPWPLGLNPASNYGERRIILASDRKLDDRVEAALQAHIEHSGFEVSRKVRFDASWMAKFTQVPAFQRSLDDTFCERWAKVTQAIDVPTLLQYAAVENPWLHETLTRRLVRGKGVADAGDAKNVLKKVLLQNARRAWSQEGVIHYDFLLSEAVELEQAHKGPHVVMVLDTHQLVAPLSVQPDGQLSYHFVGRGCYYFGASQQLDPGKKNHLAVIVTATMPPDRNIRIGFANEIFDHEMIGHRFLGLMHDHFDLPSDACVMAAKRSKQEYVHRAETYTGLYLCKQCRAKVDSAKRS